MKTRIIFNLYLLLSVLFSLPLCDRGTCYSQGVSFSSQGLVPDASALLDIDATGMTPKGILIPRITLTSITDMTTIATPATSLLVYNTGTGALVPAGYYFNSGTTGAAAWVRFITSDHCRQAIPTAQYPTFDAGAPYLLSGALWVGYDATAGCWKYNKQASGRGITDPGNPNTWSINGSTINYFDGDKNDLPSGTHVNNRYNPRTMASKYSEDDIMVKTGSHWTDKYESRIIDVSGPTWKDNDDITTPFTPTNSDIRGNGQGISPTWMAFSQKNRGSSGMSWFVAQLAAFNTGKRLLSNAEWQRTAAGTLRTDATGMTANGEDWSSIADQDVSRYGVIGMAGSLYEWVAEWGQAGPDNGVANGAFIAQPNPYNGDGTWNVGGATYCLITNTWVAGLPAAIFRGGSYNNGTNAGVFDFNLFNAPSNWGVVAGFRCGCK